MSLRTCSKSKASSIFGMILADFSFFFWGVIYKYRYYSQQKNEKSAQNNPKIDRRLDSEQVLKTIRSEIDAIDEQIVALLEQRFQLVLQMKSLKWRLTDKEREKVILSQINSVYIQNIYKEVFRNSKKLLLDEGFQPGPSCVDG